MHTTIKIILFCISLPGIGAFGIVLYSQTRDSLVSCQDCRIAAGAFLAGILLWVCAGRFLRFFYVFEHELTHLLFGLLFLKRPKSIMASAEGGRVDLYGGNVIITLSPYFFPGLSMLLVAAFPFIDLHYQRVLYALLGFTAGYHIISTMLEFKFHQPDIREAGPAFSLVFCFFANIIMIGFIGGFIYNGFPGGADFIKNGLLELLWLVRYVAELGAQLCSIAKAIV